MYFLVLVAFLEIETVQPQVAATLDNLNDCLIAAAKANKVDQLDEPRPPGLLFVCAKLVPHT